eukprot:6057792-Alexandrium_andersonii.AAC.1
MFSADSASDEMAVARDIVKPFELNHLNFTPADLQGVLGASLPNIKVVPVSYTHLRAHETSAHL